jgi:hypothetical protein
LVEARHPIESFELKWSNQRPLLPKQITAPIEGCWIQSRANVPQLLRFEALGGSGCYIFVYFPDLTVEHHFMLTRTLFGTLAATLYCESTNSVMSYFNVEAKRIATSLSLSWYFFLIHMASCDVAT